MGEKRTKPFQLSFNGSLKVDFQGSHVTSDRDWGRARTTRVDSYAGTDGSASVTAERSWTIASVPTIAALAPKLNRPELILLSVFFFQLTAME